MEGNGEETWQAVMKEKEFNDLLMEWNRKINLVSRKKTDVFDLIEDSKIFFEAIEFKEGIKILDLGTGGGFPGMVIAIHHPEAELTLLDSIEKKLKVVDDIIEKLALKNTSAICSRAEDLPSTPQTKTETYKKYFDYIVARSVAPLQDLAKWSKDLLKPAGKLVTVKGGEFSGETHKTRKLAFVESVEVSRKGEKALVVVKF
jgi:16S rRNA (guanine527-N7)-methyltransferase